MASKNKYWTGLEELRDQESFNAKAQNEFPAEMSVDEFLGNSGLSETSTGRRDFLKFLGFSVTAATLAACETPVIKSIPYVNKPEDITPGVANYYASTYVKGSDYANVLVKTREGRPIYIKGNKEFGISKGSVNARINSSVLDLYNTARVKEPVLNGEGVSWNTLDTYVKGAIAKTKEEGKKVVFLTESVVSPSLIRALNGLKKTVANENGGLDVVVYEPVSYSGILKANETTLGKAVIPSYNLAKANTVVAVGADFLNNWLNPSVLTNQYLANRMPENGKMSKHYQFEACMSLSGSNADVRVAVKPSEEGLVLAAIYNHIAKAKGAATLSGVSAELSALTKKAATDLLSSQGKSVVLVGSNAEALQLLGNQINGLLGNYGSVILPNTPLNTLQFTEDKLDGFLADVKAGKVGLVITNNVNPVYSSAKADAVKAALAKVSATVALAEYADETASACKAIAPINNWLESWADNIVIAGEYAIAQPVISALHSTRQALESVLTWSGNPAKALSYIQETAQTYLTGVDAWNMAVHNGSATYTVTSDSLVVNTAIDLSKVQSGVAKLAKVTGDFEVVLYQKTGIGAGEQAANPWLQELPDPISKVTWDNYLTMSPVDVENLGLNDEIAEQSPASVVTLSVNGKEITAPVYPQPGQKVGTLGLALGYGRGANGENIGKSAFQTAEYGGYIEDENGVKKPIGVNAFPLVQNIDGANVYFTAGSINSTGETYPLACTQTHHTVMGRTSVVRETSLTTFVTEDKDVYNPAHTLAVHGEHGMEQVDIKEVDLWAQHPVEGVGHRWGMSVDLSLCLGCGSCVTACHTENNVPVVGKDEVRRSRDMHWMRIDRYYSSSEETKMANGEDFSFGEMEKPEENPAVVHMPMMCQHCNHAPCETVCPVAATTHSNEGLNQMTYNRCIGTRYCANNCPYKVRRFNWFNYQAYKKFTEVNPSQDSMGRMVLNPDVAVRARGVMEKCSLCVQRIQEGKLVAKKAGRPVKDGDVQSACSESCPTEAIVFGDLNDVNSKIAKRAASKRAYSALEEVGTRPNIYYQVKVRNVEENVEA